MDVLVQGTNVKVNRNSISPQLLIPVSSKLRFLSVLKKNFQSVMLKHMDLQTFLIRSQCQ